MSRRKVKILVGADPEFELVDENGCVQTNIEEIIGEGYASIHFVDAYDDYNYSRLQDFQVGVDGAGDAVEFRPRPGADAKRLVEHMRTLFRRFKKKFGEFSLSVQGDEVAVGAHIHFGVALDGVNFRPFTPGTHCAKLFDYVIGELLMDQSGAARVRHNYLVLSNCRTNDHGFEYRTPSAITFAKPAYAELSVRLLKAAFEYYLQHRTKVNNAEPAQLRILAVEIQSKVLKGRDYETLVDIEQHNPTTGEDVVKYWLPREV